MAREAAPKSKVRASLLRVKWKGNGDFVIAQFRAEEGVDHVRPGMIFSAKGTIMNPTENDTYLLEGWWENNEKFGWTLKVAGYVRDVALPSSTEGIREYLLRKVKHIGPRVADAIVAAFGAETIEVLRTQPMRVAENISGITAARAEEIAATLQSQAKEVELEIAIRTITQHADLNQRQINAILKAYGHEAPTILKQDPYRLIEEVSGIGWRSADAIAKVVGYPEDGDARIRAGILYTIEDAGQTQGHLYLGREELAVLAMRNLGVGLELCERGVALAIEKAELKTFRMNHGQIDVALAKSHNDERLIAGKIIRFLMTPNPEGEEHVESLAEMWLDVAEGREAREEEEEAQEIHAAQAVVMDGEDEAEAGDALEPDEDDETVMVSGIKSDKRKFLQYFKLMNPKATDADAEGSWEARRRAAGFEFDIQTKTKDIVAIDDSELPF